jgi:hypothetical protein
MLDSWTTRRVAGAEVAAGGLHSWAWARREETWTSSWMILDSDGGTE